MPATLEGIDVSMWQNEIDWAAVKRAGKKFAIIKATEGIYGSDPQFRRNWEECGRLGIPRMAYHFLRSNEDGRQQAEFHHAFVRANGKFVIGDGCMIDHETEDGAKPSQMVACAESFAENILARTHCGVFYYVGYYFWHDSMLSPESRILAKLPLVEPAYGANPVTIPLWPNGPTIWQYSDNGRVSGINTAVDLDRAYCDMPTLRKLLKEGGRA